MEKQGNGKVNRLDFLTGLGAAATIGSVLALRRSRANAASEEELFAYPDRSSSWKTSDRYPDLANRESIYNYIFSNAQEQYGRVQIRIGGVPSSTQYILHTTDENLAGESADSPGYGELAGSSAVNNHVVCIRTKPTPGVRNGANGFKYTVYSSWDPCYMIPNGNPQDFEHYDYQDIFNNRKDMGNSYYDTGQNQNSGYNKELTGIGVFNTQLNCALLDTARPNYFTSRGQNCGTPPTCPPGDNL